MQIIYCINTINTIHATVINDQIFPEKGSMDRGMVPSRKIRCSVDVSLD